jgi:hypothetical protein
MQRRGHVTIATSFHSPSHHYAAPKRRSHFLTNRALMFPLFSVACVLVLHFVIFLAHSPKSIAQRGDFSRDIPKEDRRFLDSLFEKINYEDRTVRESSPAPIEKIDNAGKLESCTKTIPRAMLMVNTEILGVVN